MDQEFDKMIYYRYERTATLDIINYQSGYHFFGFGTASEWFVKYLFILVFALGIYISLANIFRSET